MSRQRPLLCAVLMLALVATSLGVAMARGVMAADRQLCAVTGPADIVLAHDGLPLFDAGGTPVMLDTDVCLECNVSAFGVPPGPVPAPRALGMPSALDPAAHGNALFAVWRLGGAGRGPPFAG